MQASPVGLWVCGMCLTGTRAYRPRFESASAPPPPPPPPLRFLWVETVLVYSLCHGTLIPGVACPCNEIAHCRSERRMVWGYCSLIQVIELFMASCSLPLLGLIFNPVRKNEEPTQPEPLTLFRPLPPTSRTWMNCSHLMSPCTKAVRTHLQSWDPTQCSSVLTFWSSWPCWPGFK